MRLWLAVLLVMLPVAALAQVRAPSGANLPPTPRNLRVRPNDFAHPAMPWWFWRGQAYGQVLGYIPVLSRDVTIQSGNGLADGPPSEPAEQVVTVPGYYIAETTTGYVYPERWELQELAVGVYQWRLLPAEFLPK